MDIISIMKSMNTIVESVLKLLVKTDESGAEEIQYKNFGEESNDPDVVSEEKKTIVSMTKSGLESAKKIISDLISVLVIVSSMWKLCKSLIELIDRLGNKESETEVALE